MTASPRSPSPSPAPSGTVRASSAFGIKKIDRRWRLCHEDSFPSNRSAARSIRGSPPSRGSIRNSTHWMPSTMLPRPISRVADDTIIVPGHGKPVSNKAELKECRDMLVAIRDKVANLKRQGKSRDETVAAKPTAPFDAKWGQFVIDGAYFTRLVYEGV